MWLCCYNGQSGRQLTRFWNTFPVSQNPECCQTNVSFLKRNLHSNPFCSSCLKDSLSGPDVESFTSEITLQVPTQADLRHKLASLSSTCTDSASQDTEAGEEEYNNDVDEDDEREQAANHGSLLIQPDLEEVEEDARLLERGQNRPIKNCESSSSFWKHKDERQTVSGSDVISGVLFICVKRKSTHLCFMTPFWFL